MYTNQILGWGILRVSHSSHYLTCCHFKLRLMSYLTERNDSILKKLVKMTLHICCKKINVIMFPLRSDSAVWFSYANILSVCHKNLNFLSSDFGFLFVAILRLKKKIWKICPQNLVDMHCHYRWYELTCSCLLHSQ